MRYEGNGKPTFPVTYREGTILRAGYAEQFHAEEGPEKLCLAAYSPGTLVLKVKENKIPRDTEVFFTEIGRDAQSAQELLKRFRAKRDPSKLDGKSIEVIMQFSQPVGIRL